MKIREVFDSWIADVLGYNITLYPFIFYSGVPAMEVRVHEFTHILQIRTKGIIGFYFDYLWQYLKGRLSGLDHYDSYMAISYEVEAYENQRLFAIWYYSLDQDLRKYVKPEQFARGGKYEKSSRY